MAKMAWLQEADRVDAMQVYNVACGVYVGMRGTSASMATLAAAAAGDRAVGDRVQYELEAAAQRRDGLEES